MTAHSLVLPGLLAASALMGCASTPPLTVPDAPEALRAPAGQALLAEVPATGVQIYTCAPVKEQPTRFEWVFKAPEADLFDTAGKPLGKHFAGPTWTTADGSSVVGEVKARDNGTDTTAIPWLLLSAKSTAGSGWLSRVQSIQRLKTVAGKAPATGCGAESAGREARVPYTATYYFYGSKA